LESASLGGLKIGRLNTGTLSAWGVASVFGTALGSGYGSAGQFSRFGGTATTFWNTAPTRFNNAFEYQSPAVNGFTARLLFVPKVNQSNVIDDSGLSAALANVNGIQSTAAAATGGSMVNAGVNRVGVTDISLGYSKGDFNAMVAQQKISVGDQGVSALVGVGPAATAGTTHTFNTLAANYTMGAFRVLGGVWTEKQNTATAINIAGRIIGARYVMGATTLMASMASTDDKSAANVDRKITGLGAEYALSKRSTVWARYENRDANSNVAADTNAAGVTKTAAVGVRHTF
jgi:predicted porin